MNDSISPSLLDPTRYLLTMTEPIRCQVCLCFLFWAQGRESWTYIWIFVSYSVLL